MFANLSAHNRLGQEKCWVGWFGSVLIIENFSSFRSKQNLSFVFEAFCFLIECREREAEFPASYSSSSVRQKSLSLTNYHIYTGTSLCFVLDHYIYLVDPGHTNKVAKLDSKLYHGGDYCIEFQYRYEHTQFIKSRKWTVFMGHNLHWESRCHSFIEAH